MYTFDTIDASTPRRGLGRKFHFRLSCHTAKAVERGSVRWIRYTRSELIPKRFVMPKRKRGSEKKTSVLTARVQTETKDAAKEYAKKSGESLSAFINATIEEKLKGRKNSSDKIIDRTVFSEAKAEEFPGEKKIPLFLRLTKSELAALDCRAKEFGVSKQGYLTLLLRKDLLGTIMLVEKEREAVIDSTVAMNKIGVNLNQIAHALNILMDDREKRSIPFKELKLQIAKLSSYIENHLYKTEKILKGAKTRTNIKKEDGRGERI